MEAVDTVSSMEQKKDLTELFLEDFEVQQQFPLGKQSKEELKKRSPVVFSLYTLDFLICHLVIGPSTVAVWRGVWDYSHVWLEDGLLQGDAGLTNILALLVGLIINSTIDLQHGWLAEQAGKVGGLGHKVVRLVFSLSWGSADILMWRGLWEGYDYWAGEGLTQSAVSTVLGLAILSSSFSLRSAQSSPLGVNVDVASQQIYSRTFLQTGGGDLWGRRLLDLFLSRIIEFASILAWHGLWTTTDYVTEIHLGMDETRMSWWTFSISLVGSVVTFCSQFLLLSLYKNSAASCQYLFLPFYSLQLLLQVYLTVSGFRASWSLMDVYWLPDQPELSQLTAMAAGLVLLILLQATTCLHPSINNDHPREGVLVDYHYTSYWYMKRIAAKDPIPLEDEELANLRNGALTADCS